ncbi:S41 family peptidase [Niabella sp. CJ426]|uniref:S41 family peptidase n=1 Tax=Niabella sp. CJ426 TaxID=3393740 RepID=UPI003CFCA539
MRSITCLMFTAVIHFTGLSLHAQTSPALFSPAELQEDLNHLRHLITTVHVNPYSELTPVQYDSLFNHISASLKDSATATDLFKKIRPVLARLSDEHAQLNLKTELLDPIYRSKPVYPPFTLKKEGNTYRIGYWLGNAPPSYKELQPVSINGMPLEKLLRQCALATTGYPDQRMATALHRFGYLYPWAADAQATEFTITGATGQAITVPGIGLKEWETFLAAQQVSACPERVSYTRHGTTGYINACSFDVQPKGKYSVDSIRATVDGIFEQIKLDGVNRLIIDVSRNEGGSTAVGDYLISYIYRQPYLSYQTNWKRSDEYLKLLRSWGFDNAPYAAEPVGKVLHFASDRITPESVPNPFKGKTVVVIGAATFSSAMNFATLVKDNNIAPLMGQTPVNGHPTSFGEMFYTNLPHTQLFVRFGVKEHIRPAGKTPDNNLHPDLPLTDAQMRDINTLIRKARAIP